MTENTQNISLFIDRSEGNADIPTLVVRQISRYIISGKLIPGDKLPSELEMTRQFGISRISLREAMKLLEAKGYIESKGRRGKFVRPITGESFDNPLSAYVSSGNTNLSQLLEVERILCGEIAAMAASTATENDIMDLWRILAMMEANVRHSVRDQTGMILSHYNQFLIKLSQTSHNKVLSHLVISFSSILKHSLTAIYANQKGTDVLNHLSAILGAIEKRSSIEAKTAVYKHIDFLRNKLCL